MVASVCVVPSQLPQTILTDTLVCSECPVSSTAPGSISNLLLTPLAALPYLVLSCSRVHLQACGRLVQENLLNAHLDLSCASGSASSTSHSSSQPGPSSSSSSSWSLPQPSSSSSKAKPPIPPSEVSQKKRKDASQPDAQAKRLKPSQAAAGTAALEAAKPLAELVRPSTVDDIVGQTHLLAKPSGLLRSLIEHDRLGSFVLWGPPGTGKTTLAAVIAKSTKSAFRQVSATSAGATDVRKIFEEAANVLKLTGCAFSFINVSRLRLNNLFIGRRQSCSWMRFSAFRRPSKTSFYPTSRPVSYRAS